MGNSESLFEESTIYQRLLIDLLNARQRCLIDRNYRLRMDIDWNIGRISLKFDELQKQARKDKHYQLCFTIGEILYALDTLGLNIKQQDDFDVNNVEMKRFHVR